MLSHIIFEEIQKPGLLKKLSDFYKKTEYINKVTIDYLNNYYIEVKIKYYKEEKTKKVVKKINEALRQMSEYNVSVIILNKDCIFYGEILKLGLNIYNPDIFFKKNIVKIIYFLSNKENIEKKENITVICDKDFENLSIDFLSELINVSHMIYIDTNMDRHAYDLIDELYEQKGIPIVLLKDFDILKKANFIVLFKDAQEFLKNTINKNAYIITPDPFLKINKSCDNIIVTGFDLKLKNGIKIDIPKGISTMEFLGVLSEYYDTDLILNLEISNIITSIRQ